MKHTRLKALSPADGRYADKVGPLRDILSEFGLIRHRVLVEVRWLQWLADEAGVAELPSLSSVMKDVLNQLVDEFDADDAERIKEIEATSNHDVKAVEYFFRERIGSGSDVKNIGDFIHFACTSEDINNLAYALMLRTARDEVLQPQMRELSAKLRAMNTDYAGLAMLSRTHGQAASPTTLGKELANIVARLSYTREQFASVAIRGKFNGAVGNFNAHIAAYPDVDWPQVTSGFVESLGLVPNEYTTQIEPHDWTAAYAHALMRYNTVLIDFCRDVWSYVSLGYFRQRAVKDEVGSSTMPHKVNPIDFENAEGNLGLANAMLGHFASKLPVSRWQRDLTDSTVQRNFGTAIAYTVIAVRSVIEGLGKLQADPATITRDLEQRWELLGEAVQSVMRRYGVSEPYEKLKTLTRGQSIDREVMQEFIRNLEIPDDAKQRLLKLTPTDYTGLAEALARKLG